LRKTHHTRSSTPTLHQAWTRTVATLVALIFGLGGVALTATQYQRIAFEHTTSGLKRETTALAGLSHALVVVNGLPTVGILYGNPGNLASNRAAFRVIQGNVNVAFSQTETAFRTPAETATLADANQTWRALDLAINNAPQRFSHQAVLAALVAGHDPFQRLVWDRLNATEADVADVAQLSAAELGSETARVGRIEGLIAPLVAVALALALILSWQAARRMSHQVLNPILKLRRAALAIGDSNDARPIDLPGATAELQDLAATINDTAASLRASHNLLRDQAFTDALTGLPNRKAFTERLHAKLAEPGGGPLGVLFVDLDDFKNVNDSLGHAAGDELLRVVGHRLRSATRDCEIVARLGGDEFAIAVDCTDHAGVATAVAVAERTLAALQERVSIENSNLSIGASIGIAMSEAGAGAEAADALLRNADFSMYVAKGQGKNRLEVFAPSMHAEMVALLEFKHELGQAARLGQFVLHYQPVVDLNSGGVIGFEALIRWQHPSRGLIAPAYFIPLAEDTGDILEIGRWVIDQACQDCAARRSIAHGSADVWMSVNISAYQLTDPTFVATVKAALQRHDIPPSALILELTESVALTNPATATGALAELRRYGVHVALDDFGMGFSSLRYLHDLPIDMIKIDRSFVMMDDGQPNTMLEAIITMGQSLGLAVIAEGIEAADELERLRGFDRLAGQGYYIARPMPATAAAAFLRGGLSPAPLPPKLPSPALPAA
jgi:diguanylate cyclase (GGDEF)-like protein